MAMQSIVNTNRMILAGALIFLVLFISYIHIINPRRNSVLVQDISQTRSWFRHNGLWTRKGGRQRWPDKQLQPLPSELQDAALSNNDRLKLIESYVEVSGDYLVYFRQVKPVKPKPNGGVLFLHGRNYTSLKWLEMGTLHLVANMGYRAVAIDLPGYGNTQRIPLPTTSQTLDFMRRLLNVLQLNKPVLVSPSMSGNYSLPLVMEQPDVLSGFVSISPVAAASGGKYNAAQYKQNQNPPKFPVMIVCSELERLRIGTDSRHPLEYLQTLPNARLFSMLSDGNQPIIVTSREQRTEFHILLYNLLSSIESLR